MSRTPIDLFAQPHRRLAGMLLIFVATVLAYWPVYHAGFIWDDDSYVTENNVVAAPDGWLQAWIPNRTPQYYPVVFSTFWIEHRLWGLSPTGYHIVNVLLHAANALLVWRFGARLRIPGTWLIGAVFAVHPVHVESVAWITERKNVLSGLFYLLAAVSYLRFDDLRFPLQQDARSRPWMAYTFALGFFVLALLSKSVTCSLPAALILMLLHQHKPLSLQRLIPLVPFFIIGLVLALHTASIERQHVGAQGADFVFTFPERLLIACKALLFYPAKLFVPSPLMFIYPRWTIDAFSWASYGTVATVSVIAIGAAVLFIRGNRGPGLALAFYAGTILPALGFINVYPMLFSFVADHFQYLASLGIIALIVGGAAWLLGERRIIITGIVILPILMILTWRQAGIYRNAETIWRDTLSKNESSWMPHSNLASALIRRGGDAIAAGDRERGFALIDEAIQHAQRVLQLRPEHPQALSNMAEALRLQGHPIDALPFALRYLAALENLFTHRIRNVNDNTPVPSLAEAHWQLGRLQELSGSSDLAVDSYRAALHWNPADATASAEMFRLSRSLGEDARRASRFSEAETHFRDMLAAVRSDDQHIDAGYRLANLLATADDPVVRKPQEAVAIAERITLLAEQTGRTSPYILDVLAAAYFQVGRRDDAVRTAEAARDLARRLHLDDLASGIAAKLDRYRSAAPP